MRRLNAITQCSNTTLTCEFTVDKFEKKTIIVIDSGFTSYGALGHVSPGFQQFHFSSLWSKSDSQLSKYCVVYEISWCICQQLTALSISTALVTKLLFIKPLLHPALKSAVSAP